jgi:serine/threonine protein phosphatase 1
MNTVQRLPRNTLGRDFVVGDIHGRFDLLRVLMASVGFHEDRDRMISVGDMVDRGVYSEQFSEYLLQPWFYAVCGNHEQLAMDHVVGLATPLIYSSNGGDWFLALGKSKQVQYAQQMAVLPLAIEIDTAIGRVGVIHADCPTSSWDEFLPQLQDDYGINAALWSRDRRFNHDPVSDMAYVIIGHTPVKEPSVRGNVINIDTAAFKTGNLTMVELIEPLVFHNTADHT